MIRQDIYRIDFTRHLALPHLLHGQAQKHVTVNGISAADATLGGARLDRKR